MCTCLGFAVPVASAGGVFRPVFINEDVTIIVVGNNNVVNFVKIFVGDPPSPDLSNSVNPFPSPKTTATVSGNTATVTWTSSNAADTLGSGKRHIGIGFNGVGPSRHPLEENPGAFQWYATLKDGTKTYLPLENTMLQTSPSSPARYAVVHTTVTSGGVSVSEWSEFAYNGTYRPSYQIPNSSPSFPNMTFSDVGSMTSATQIPIADLTVFDPVTNPNGIGSPEHPNPANAGLWMRDANVPDGTVGQPGQTLQGQLVPEPPAIVLLGMGILGLLAGAVVSSRLGKVPT
jgi:hypothetical protein